MRQHLPVALPQPRARGPARGGEAVEVRAALGRRALDQDEAIGGEDRDGRALAGDRRRVGRVAVEQMAAALAAAHRGEQRALGAVLGPDRRFGAGQGGAEGDHVAAIPGPEGAAGEGEVERLEEVRLAGAVGTDQAGDALPQLDPELAQTAQRCGLDRGDQHR